jgi:oligoendopeptidase F
MEQDQMKIDPNVLELFISFIERYAIDQEAILNNYISKMKNLYNDWDDPKGYVEMMKNLEQMNKRSIQVIEQIRMTYKKFYYDEVLDIRKNLNSIKV